MQKPTKLKHQAGLTLISMAFLLAIIGSLVLLALKMVPIYLEHGKVKGALESLQENAKTDKQSMGAISEAAIKTNLSKLFSMNSVDVSLDNLQITREANNFVVTMEYEKVEPIVGNVSILILFSDSVEISR